MGGPPAAGDTTVPVSVIVTTRNSARTLEACLRSVRAQDHPAVELVVVDNGSTDDTLVIAGTYCDQLLEKGPERSAQRNHGAAQSHGDLLLFVDSDMELEPAVISQGVALLARPDVRGVVIPEVSFGEGFWTRCRTLERSCYADDNTVEAARMFRREQFLDVGGFDEELTGAEDWDVSGRIAGRDGLARTTAIIRHDEGRIELRSSYVKRRYYAPGYLRYLRKHRGDAVSQGNALLRPAFLRHWRDLGRQPGVAAGMFLLKALDAAAVGQVAAEEWVLGRTSNRSRQVYGSSGTKP